MNINRELHIFYFRDQYIIMMQSNIIFIYRLRRIKANDMQSLFRKIKILTIV